MLGQHHRRWSSIQTALGQCIVGVVGLSISQKTRDIHPMLGQRRRRWANIDTALGECPLFAGYSLVKRLVTPAGCSPPVLYTFFAYT